MARSSVKSIRSVRPDGTPVYRYDRRPGRLPVSVRRFDTAAEHAELPPDHRHVHEYHVLLYVEQGGGSFAVEGEERSLRPGTVHALAPGEVVGVAAASASRGRAWSVAFAPDAVPALADVSPLVWAHHPLLALFAPGAGSAVVPVADRERWRTALEDLAAELDAAERLGAHDAAGALLTRLLVESARLAPTAPSAPDPVVARVFDEIEATFRDPVSSADVARALGYTPGHLTTVVRQRTGRPLLAWITERRLTEARRLLRDTDLPLAVVAARTGLRDASYLVRRFRDRYGVTPEAWRRGQRG
jgi:AraC-like DNA-binding protein